MLKIKDTFYDNSKIVVTFDKLSIWNLLLWKYVFKPLRQKLMKPFTSPNISLNIPPITGPNIKPMLQDDTAIAIPKEALVSSQTSPIIDRKSKNTPKI